MSEQKEYNINGKVYVLKEETPEPVKREPIKAYAHLYDSGLKNLSWTNLKQYREGFAYLDCIELQEVPKDARVVTREELARAWNNTHVAHNHGYSSASKSDVFKALCKSLGFSCEDKE